jgi:hypothetical protein
MAINDVLFINNCDMWDLDIDCRMKKELKKELAEKYQANDVNEPPEK